MFKEEQTAAKQKYYNALCLCPPRLSGLGEEVKGLPQSFEEKHNRVKL